MAPRKSTAANTGAKTTAPTASKTAARKTTAAPRSTTPRPRKGPQTIRNLRGVTVHARLYELDPDKLFRIALNPRGESGDTKIIPVNRQTDPTFLEGIGVLWEIIPETEAKKIKYGPVGYLGRSEAVQVIRPADTTVATAPDWDGISRRVPEDREIKRTQRGRQSSEREFGTGMHTADLPGTDTALHAQLKAAQEAGSSALPPGADVGSRRVVIERVQGQ